MRLSLSLSLRRLACGVALAFLLSPLMYRAGHASVEARHVYFAGFSMAGNFATRAERFPFTVKALEQQPDVIDRRLQDAVRSNASQNLQLSSESLAVLAKGQSLVATLFLDRESVSIERIDDLHKAVIALSAQIMVVDFDGLNIVASFPIGVHYVDVFDHDPSEQELVGLVGRLYFGGEKLSLISEFEQALAAVSIQSDYPNRLRIGNVELGEKAVPALPARMREHPEEARAYLADAVGRYLVKHQNVALLPYVKGQAVAKLSASFADGSVYNLTIPEGDYLLDLDLLGFKKIKIDEQAHGQSWVYGAFLGARLYEPLQSKTYLQVKMKQGATKVIPASQKTVDDWAAFEESLLLLVDGFARQLGDPDSGWIEKHAYSEDAEDQFPVAVAIVEKCK